MSKEKPDKQVKARTISNAPPPPPKIPSGDAGLRSRRPDWSYWNNMPMLSINECVFLLINVEPNEYLSYSKRQHYDRVLRLVRSFQAVGELPEYDIAPREFIAWARSIGEEPHEEWKPKGVQKIKVEQVVIDAEDSSSIEFKIADDIYNRMNINYDGKMRNVGRQRIYNFLIQESNADLPSRYGLPKISYRLIDKKAERDYLEVGRKKDLDQISIQCKSNGIDVDSITFRSVCNEFICIRDMNKYK